MLPMLPLVLPCIYKQVDVRLCVNRMFLEGDIRNLTVGNGHLGRRETCCFPLYTLIYF